MTTTQYLAYVIFPLPEFLALFAFPAVLFFGFGLLALILIEVNKNE
ncbi:MAG TPA: hypothetical protein VLL52_22495 [Anaerolineae bacterium]|nr:hypothetical protein [Anaerolineae bacterium]